MTAVLTKPADGIGVDDIRALISEQVPEGARIEFKESLPAGKGKSDPWLTGGGGFGKRAKEEILEEVVAFANAFGGALVLGVAEDRDKPPVAARIAPLPRCADLAARFRQIFGACVDPQLPALEVVPIPTGDDSGVVVFRTDRSRRGPHRVRPTRKCPVRRADSCEELDMREIQDMTLNLARGTERLERRLRERSRQFLDEFARLETSDNAFGFRMTAVPVGDEVRFDSVWSDGGPIEELRPPEVEIGRGTNGQDSRLRTIQSSHDMRFDDWRPMLRAARAEDSHESDQGIQRYAYAEIHADGLLEYGIVSNLLFRHIYNPDSQVEMAIDSETPVSTLAQLLIWADRVRQRASAPGAEYVVQPRFTVTADSVHVAGNDYRFAVGKIGQNDTDFPLYPLRDFSQIGNTVSLFERDFWNYFGKDSGSRSREPLSIVPAPPHG